MVSDHPSAHLEPTRLNAYCADVLLRAMLSHEYSAPAPLSEYYAGVPLGDVLSHEYPAPLLFACALGSGALLCRALD